MKNGSYELVCKRLQKKFGELVPLKAVAELLHCKSAAIRKAMTCNKKEPRIQLLRQAKRKIGKRIFFNVESIAAVVALPDEAILRELDDAV